MASARGAGLRSRDIVGLMSGQSMWRLIRGMVRAPFDDKYAGSPLAVCWFTNFTCNARCPFCCKAGEIREAKDRFAMLEMEGVTALLARVRRTVDMLYVSGGEPLVHPRIVEIVREARRLGFRSVGMSSNLIALDRVPEVLDYLDVLSVSIHSPDVTAHAAHLGVPRSVAQRVFDNLQRVKQHPRRAMFKVLVNCVISASNLDSVLHMIEFTRENGFLLELVPANERGRPPASLAGNAQYESVIDRVLAERRAGRAPHLAGSTHYYGQIRRLEPFRCFPYGVPNIMPDGRLCTPCDVAEQYAVNVLDHPDLKSALRASLPHMGEFPCREGYCFKAGIIERSRLFGLVARRLERHPRPRFPHQGHD